MHPLLAALPTKRKVRHHRRIQHCRSARLDRRAMTALALPAPGRFEASHQRSGVPHVWRVPVLHRGCHVRLRCRQLSVLQIVCGRADAIRLRECFCARKAAHNTKKSWPFISSACRDGWARGPCRAEDSRIIYTQGRGPPCEKTAPPRHVPPAAPATQPATEQAAAAAWCRLRRPPDGRPARRPRAAPQQTRSEGARSGGRASRWRKKSWARDRRARVSLQLQ